MIKKCVFLLFLMQPDGAESVASVYSSDTASDKRAASHHTHNSATPTISVSRASGSSGTDQQLWLHFVMCNFIKQLLTSHAKTSDVLEAFVMLINYPVKAASLLGEGPDYWNTSSRNTVICLKIHLSDVSHWIIAAKKRVETKGAVLPLSRSNFNCQKLIRFVPDILLLCFSSFIF